MAKNIPLTQGKFTIVDENNYERLSKYKWYASSNRRSYYAARKVRENGKTKTVWMHREITGALPGFQVDHINGITLDNQEENLRVCTVTENQRNQKNCNRKGDSHFKGVSSHGSRWRATIVVNGKQKRLGTFATEELAAREYDKAAKCFFGEFANLNFPSIGCRGRNRGHCFNRKE